MKAPRFVIWKQLTQIFPANEEHRTSAASLYRKYKANGWLNSSPEEILKLDIPVIADFFRRIVMMHSTETPILRRKDARWMSEFDYTHFNIRATGIDGKTGNFINASIFLATLKTQGIILAPVTLGPTENLRQMESHAVIREELAEKVSLAAGLTTELQLKAFCEAAHLLGLVIGYELDYRVDPYAKVVHKKPEFFLWTQNGCFDEDQAHQHQLQSMVHQIQASGREGFQSELTRLNLAPRLSVDKSGRTFLSLKNTTEETATYWSRVFDMWRDRFGYDFLVLCGTRSDQDSDNQDEIPDLPLIQKVSHAARKSGIRPNIGVIAEGWTKDVEAFGHNGVNLVLNNDSDSNANRQWFEETFELDNILQKINLGRKIRFSVPLQVSPGEKDITISQERALIKRFVCRFLGAGPARRPLLETMGSLHGAWGYNHCLRNSQNLNWAANTHYTQKSLCIENTALIFKDILQKGQCIEKHLSDMTAWWIIQSKKGMLIAIVSVENENLLPPDQQLIEYAGHMDDRTTIVEYDFSDIKGTLHLSTHSQIDTGTTPYMGFKLYAIT